MFGQIQNLPLHPLAVHAAVVLVPLAALLGLLFVLPRTRRMAGLPMALVSVVAALSVIVAKLSGQRLKSALERLNGGKQWDDSSVGKLVQTHQNRANLLVIMMMVFAVIAVAAYLLSRRADSFTGMRRMVVCVLLVVGAVALGVQVYQVGDAGSRAVWNPDGTVNYGSSATISAR